MFLSSNLKYQESFMSFKDRLAFFQNATSNNDSNGNTITSQKTSSVQPQNRSAVKEFNHQEENKQKQQNPKVNNPSSKSPQNIKAEEPTKFAPKSVPVGPKKEYPEQKQSSNNAFASRLAFFSNQDNNNNQPKSKSVQSLTKETPKNEIEKVNETKKDAYKTEETKFVNSKSIIEHSKSETPKSPIDETKKNIPQSQPVKTKSAPSSGSKLSSRLAIFENHSSNQNDTSKPSPKKEETPAYKREEPKKEAPKSQPVETKKTETKSAPSSGSKLASRLAIFQNQSDNQNDASKASPKKETPAYKREEPKKEKPQLKTEEPKKEAPKSQPVETKKTETKSAPSSGSKLASRLAIFENHSSNQNDASKPSPKKEETPAYKREDPKKEAPKSQPVETKKTEIKPSSSSGSKLSSRLAIFENHSSNQNDTSKPPAKEETPAYKREEPKKEAPKSQPVETKKTETKSAPSSGSKLASRLAIFENHSSNQNDASKPSPKKEETPAYKREEPKKEKPQPKIEEPKKEAPKSQPVETKKTETKSAPSSGSKLSSRLAIFENHSSNQNDTSKPSPKKEETPAYKREEPKKEAPKSQPVETKKTETKSAPSSGSRLASRLAIFQNQSDNQNDTGKPSPKKETQQPKTEEPKKEAPKSQPVETKKTETKSAPSSGSRLASRLAIFQNQSDNQNDASKPSPKKEETPAYKREDPKKETPQPKTEEPKKEAPKSQPVETKKTETKSAPSSGSKLASRLAIFENHSSNQNDTSKTSPKKETPAYKREEPKKETPQPKTEEPKKEAPKSQPVETKKTETKPSSSSGSKLASRLAIFQNQSNNQSGTSKPPAKEEATPVYKREEPKKEAPKPKDEEPAKNTPQPAEAKQAEAKPAPSSGSKLASRLAIFEKQGSANNGPPPRREVPRPNPIPKPVVAKQEEEEPKQEESGNQKKSKLADRLKMFKQQPIIMGAPQGAGSELPAMRQKRSQTLAPAKKAEEDSIVEAMSKDDSNIVGAPKGIVVRRTTRGSTVRRRPTII